MFGQETEKEKEHNLSKSVRQSRQINCSRMGTKFAETRLKNAGKGKDCWGGRLGEGDKNGGEKSKGSEKSFFCQEKLFRVYRRDIPCACPTAERVVTKRGDEAEGGCIFPDCYVLPSYAGIYKLHRNEVWFSSLAEELVNFQCCYKLSVKSFFKLIYKNIVLTLQSIRRSWFTSCRGLVFCSESGIVSKLY